MSAQIELLWTPTNAFEVISRIGLSRLDRDVLDVLMGLQEPGGRVVATHEVISEGLVSRGKKARDRSSVTRSMGALRMARLVRWPDTGRGRGGVYQLNEMISGFKHPEDIYDAIDKMPEDMRLDDPEYQAKLQTARARAGRHLRAI
ncbi:hypothetical protein [Kitasatospora sp. NPDC090091]|uniref:hypothetical protein n=1 Tax=Kitasatospora sp. NPDC090091 TaxID=3364081 RepID=UPI0038238D3F